MEDQSSWKGHSFTLIVFIGIVILCSIFFVLGMVVGRGQAQHSAESASSSPSAKNSAGDSHGTPQIEKSDSSASAAGAVKDPVKDTVIVVDPPPETPKADLPPAKPTAKTKVAAEAPPAPPANRPVPRPAGDKMIYLQVAALEQSAAANKQVDELRNKGFHAIIQISEGPKKLYHVQVGPFSNNADVDIARHKLEAMGYKQLVRK